MTRLSALPIENMTPAQHEIYDGIVNGPRKKFGGPFPALLRSPELANKVQALGASLRFDSSLSANLREIAILSAARHWKNQVEWDAHVVIALNDGVSQGLIESILYDYESTEASDEERLVITFCQQLMQTRFVDDDCYAAIDQAFGEAIIVELVVMLGYFSLLAMVLNSFEVSTDPVDSVPPTHLKMDI